MEQKLSFLKTLLTAGALALWAGSCKVDLPPNAFEDPVFELEFAAAGSQQNLTAGEGEIYLFTTYAVDSGLTCTGSFALSNCPDGDCPGSVTVEFHLPPWSDTSDPNTIFLPGGFDFRYVDTTGGTSYDHLTLVADSTQLSYDSFLWTVDGSPLSGDSVAIDLFSHPSTVQVQLSGEKNNGTSSQALRSIAIPPNNTTYPAVDILVENVGAISILNAQASGNGPFSYLWSDGNTASSLTTDSTSQSFYAVTITDSLGQTASASISLVNVPLGSFRSVTFTENVEKIVVPSSNEGVALQWVDAQGIIWRSDRQQQPSGNFTILESEPYERNEKGEMTRKMQVTFSCLLFNTQGDSIQFSGEGVIAVAHPD